MENEDKHLYEKELEQRVKDLEFRVKKLWDEDLLAQHEHEELIEKEKKNIEIIEKIKVWLRATIDGGVVGGDIEETGRAQGAVDLATELLEQIEKWQNG